MKQAISICLAGQLVEVDDFTEFLDTELLEHLIEIEMRDHVPFYSYQDYIDYYNKGFICPFCVEKVFYSRICDKLPDNSVRKSTSFKHYEGNSLSCDTKAESAEGKKLLKILSNDSYNQRLPIWEKHLWAMFVKRFKDVWLNNLDKNFVSLLEPCLANSLNKPLKKVISIEVLGEETLINIEELSQFYLEIMTTFRLNFVEEFTQDVEINQIDSIIFLEETLRQGITAFSESQQIIKTDPIIHQRICFEIVYILCQPNMKAVLKRILSISALFMFMSKELVNEEMLATIVDLFKGKNYTIEKHREVCGILMAVYLSLIIRVDWYELSKSSDSLALPKRYKIPSPNLGKGFGS